MTRLLHFFFHLLYHPLAPIYDLIAALVSLGRWRGWVQKVIPHIRGKDVLELGSGPGHLLVSLTERGFRATGVDQSRQMIDLARRKGKRIKTPRPWLLRAQAGALPLSPACFDTVVSTFPSPYIAQIDTLSEIQRVLRPGGRLVILLGAWITGGSLPERALALLMRITGEAPYLDQALLERIQAPYRAAGLDIRIVWEIDAANRLLFLVADAGGSSLPSAFQSAN